MNMQTFNELRDEARNALGDNCTSGTLDCDALVKAGVKVWLTDWGRSKSGKNESRDCTVRAVAAAIGCKYDEAHARLEALGRKLRKGFKIQNHLSALGLEQQPQLSCRTLRTILPELQSGRFIVRISRHVFAVVNGVAVDMEAPKIKCRVKMVYRRIEP